ncbi:MAG TPA: type II toxin-antitoxin system prevent-host-death family antitoxin [Rhizomicrobium sp.]|nr:type II toxin-antitoxin system prevent-host-death family antitoxin [Rhizomicrobium sp.]
MTRQVNLYEAKTNLSQLVEDAAKGEEIIIAKNGKPMAKLVVVAPAEAPKKRALGQWAKYLTPEQRADMGSEDWWRRWKEADAEIERDFEDSINRPFPKGYAEGARAWGDTSSTPTRSSGRKARRKSSNAKPGKSSRPRKTRS